MRNALRSVALVSFLSFSAPALAHQSLGEWHFQSEGVCDTCPSRGQYHWDYYFYADLWGSQSYASIYRGTDYAVYNCQQVYVTQGFSGNYLNTNGYNLMPDSRGIRTNPVRIGSVDVVRETHTPETGVDLTRFIDSFTNTSGGEIDVNVTYYCQYYGCSGGSCGVSSSDGDDTVERSDEWFVRDGAEDNGYPSVGLFLYQDGADVTASSITADGWGYYNAQFSLEIPAGETKRLMTFMTQTENHDDARAVMDEISFLSDVVMDDYAGGALPDVENFVTDGRPIVSVGGPYSVPEGGTIILEPFIYDREGDAFLYAWDLDADGAYDDSGDLNPLVDATMIDGDEDLDVAIYVVQEDGLHEVFKEGEVEVMNVAPIIITEPPDTARRGGLYQYRPEVIDPAGELDPIEYEIVTEDSPPEMTVDATGLVSWRPTHEDLDPAQHDVHLVVSDGDGGTFDQEWTITVVENNKPFAPLPLYPVSNELIDYERPTFLAGNSGDPDGDALTYHFRVDWDPNFRSTDGQSTDEEGLPPSASGVTQWQPTEPLLDDLPALYWEVWANDGIEDSDHMISIFRVRLEDPDDFNPDEEDAGPDGGEDAGTPGGGSSSDGAGCGCRTSGDASATPLALLSSLAVVLVWRRRR